MKHLICTLAIAILTFPASFAQAAGPTVITNPDWQSKPTGEDMGRYYPGLGRTLNLEGLTTLKCTVSSSGTLDDCKVLNEQPIGIGFGAAALGMSSVFKMKPKMINGVAVSGGEITIPIHFTLAPDENPEPLDDIPEPTAASKMLAAKLFGALGAQRWAAEYLQSVRAYMTEEIYVPTSPLEVEAHKVALQSIDEAANTGIEAYSNRFIKYFAQHMTMNELEAFIAFSETPTGKALSAGEPAPDPVAAAAFAETPAGKAVAAMVQTMQRDNSTFSKPVYQATVDDARRRFCAKMACVVTNSDLNRGAR